jgi:hypothetical protein
MAKQQDRPPLPIPDPTRITTEAIDRLQDTLKELFGTQFEAVEEKFGRLQEQMDTRPAAVVQEIAHLRQLMDEKFKGVSDQFLGRDTALAAALLAQKTSVEEQNKANAASAFKSEAGFTKLIDGQRDALAVADKSSTDKIDAVKLLIVAGDTSNSDKIEDVRTRVGALENQKKGAGDLTGWIFGGVGVIAVVVDLVSRIPH